MKDAGLLDGDRVIIDRAVEPHDGSIVVAWRDGGFTMKFLDLTHRKDGKGKADVFARSNSARLLPKGRKNAIKHDFKSKNPTTRWADVIKLH